MVDSETALSASLSIMLSNLTLVDATKLDVEGVILSENGRTFTSSAGNNKLHVVFARCGLTIPLSTTSLPQSPFKIEETTDITIEVPKPASSIILNDTTGLPQAPINDAVITAINNVLTDTLSGGGDSIKAMCLTYDSGLYVSTSFKVRLVFNSAGLYDSLLFSNLDSTFSNDVIVNLPVGGTSAISSVNSSGTQLTASILGMARLTSKTMRLDIAIVASSGVGFHLKDDENLQAAPRLPLLYIGLANPETTGLLTGCQIIRGCHITADNSIGETAGESANDKDDGDITLNSALNQVFNIDAALDDPSHLEFKSANAATVPQPSTRLSIDATQQPGVSAITVNYTNAQYVDPNGAADTSKRPNIQVFRMLRFICTIGWTKSTAADIRAVVSINKPTNAATTFFK